MGCVGGVATLLSKDIPAPCLVVIHCEPSLRINNNNNNNNINNKLL